MVIDGSSAAALCSGWEAAGKGVLGMIRTDFRTLQQALRGQEDGDWSRGQFAVAEDTMCGDLEERRDASHNAP